MAVDDFQIKNETAALRRRSDALIVLAFTPNQVFYSADPKLAPREVQRLLQDEAASIANHIATDRRKGKSR